MPRRATSTSFGAERGNKPMSPGPGARPGNTVDRFRKEMQERALRADTLHRLDKSLDAKEDAIFLKAFAEVADRGFGKAPQSIEHTGADGGPIQLWHFGGKKVQF